MLLLGWGIIEKHFFQWWKFSFQLKNFFQIKILAHFYFLSHCDLMSHYGSLENSPGFVNVLTSYLLWWGITENIKINYEFSFNQILDENNC